MASRPSSIRPGQKAKLRPAPGTFHHGSRDLNWTRYLALYVAQAGWIALGVYLLKNAFWPSSCQPTDFVQTYVCSLRLPDNRGWVEAALMTWLWSTPILVMLEISRWSKIRAARKEANTVPPRGKFRDR